MARLLEVWLFSNHVGTLAQKQGRLSVTYAPAWLAGCPPCCAAVTSQPLQADTFDDRTTRHYFAGLLPEGDKRRLANNPFQHMIGDGAGLPDWFDLKPAKPSSHGIHATTHGTQ
ncbi:MAG: HipA N-terminal domain-containing protein [Uliginosibacterium sp.]|nr:HipA N-terminal domain-containing protein [Uliginosibacterium sp.]